MGGIRPWSHSNQNEAVPDKFRAVLYFINQHGRKEVEVKDF
jgi:hypothetical protein